MLSEAELLWVMTGVPLGEFLDFELENVEDSGAKTMVSVYS